MNSETPFIGSSDLTFITNDENNTLVDRFNSIIKNAKFFDALVAYFYISGFYLIADAIESTERIRILMGIGTSEKTYEIVKEAQNQANNTSLYEAKNEALKSISTELEDTEENEKIHKGIQKFIELIKNKKLQIRVYPSHNIHAKLYIITYKQGDRDIGRVVTGSSNFSQAGLKDNLEFNVELKNSADYKFAEEKFNELWENSLDISEDVIQHITNNTWLNPNITPYMLYLKFLYEYFKDELNGEKQIDMNFDFLPKNFKKFRYQEQAVLNAKKILEAYGGVFLSDVVGLGKTYIAAMLINQLDGRTLVIAPPHLLDENNPSSWKNVFNDFGVRGVSFVSIGNLKEAEEKLKHNDYKNIIIDESHRLKNEGTIRYEEAAKICRGRRVILVSATPYNNTPRDILSQIKLFQYANKSKIPGIPDLENFFARLDKKLKEAKSKGNNDNYVKVARETAAEIREKVLKYIMVRRTRKDIEMLFPDDLKKYSLSFPEVKPPRQIYYQLNEEEDRVFTDTVNKITKEFKFARYAPLLYLKNPIGTLEQPQKNMKGFIKVLLIKRLESSFYAFRQTLERLIKSYESFIDSYKKGKIYITKYPYISSLLEEDNVEAIMEFIEEGKVKEYDTNQFKEELEKDLISDLKILNEIKSNWKNINRDPKLQTFVNELNEEPILKNAKKIVVFTESKETAEYLTNEINKRLGNGKNMALCFSSKSPSNVRDELIANFDANAENQSDEYRILVSTEVLSEGVNLHRSNVVINYDIPWNPTRIMQRVGRVNRIGTKFHEIYVYTFFPTTQAEKEIDLTNIARKKINEFLELLGEDVSILTEDEPIGSRKLFDVLTSKKLFEEEDEPVESELKYLKEIEAIRDKDQSLYQEIIRLPKKARSSKNIDSGILEEGILKKGEQPYVLTFFRKGKLVKFFISSSNSLKELGFTEAAKLLKSRKEDKLEKIDLDKFYPLFKKNKQEFIQTISSGGPAKIDNKSKKLLKYIKTLEDRIGMTNEDYEFLKKIEESVDKGGIPKRRILKVLKALDMVIDEEPRTFIEILKKEIPHEFLKKHLSESDENLEKSKNEIILSMYFCV